MEMMKVRMLTAMAGPAGTASPGAIVEVNQATAYAWCEGGYAEQIAGPGEAAEAVAAEVDAAAAAPPRKVETATAPPVEVAADVSIPPGWSKLSSDDLKALAAKLGTPGTKNKAAAIAVIRAAGG